MSYWRIKQIRRQFVSTYRDNQVRYSRVRSRGNNAMERFHGVFNIVITEHCTGIIILLFLFYCPAPPPSLHSKKTSPGHVHSICTTRCRYYRDPVVCLTDKKNGHLPTRPRPVSFHALRQFYETVFTTFCFLNIYHKYVECKLLK